MTIWKPTGSRIYYCSFEIKRRRFSHTTHSTTVKDALAYQKRWRAEERKKIERMGASFGRDMTVLDAVDRFVAEKTRKNGHAPYRDRDLDWIVEKIGPSTRLSEIDDAAVTDLVEARSQMFRWDDPKYGLVRQGTIIQTVLRPLSALLHVARDIWKIPLPDMPRFGAYSGPVFARTRELSIREELTMLPGLGAYEDLARFLLKTGFRIGSALLRRQDVHLEEGRIRVMVKGGKMHEVKITPAIKAILLRNINNPTEFVFTYERRTKEGIERRPITHSGFNWAFKRAAMEVGVKDVVIHDLRRTAGARMYRATGNIGTVSKFLGHANVLITQKHYVHITPDDVGLAMDITEAVYERHVAEAMASMTVH